MHLTVGSMNKTKITAVRDAVALYSELFPNPEVVGVDIVATTKLFDHPKNLEQTVSGAMERAKLAFRNCDYSFGLEGGLMEVPYSRTGFMEVGVCAVYDGKNFCLGISPAFEWPKEVTKMIVSGEADASQALKKLNLTEHEKLGAQAGGGIGWLTHGRLTREEFSKASILMALIQLERPELYYNL